MRTLLFSTGQRGELLKGMTVSTASGLSVALSLELLIGINGVTPLIALAFFADGHGSRLFGSSAGE